MSYVFILSHGEKNRERDRTSAVVVVEEEELVIEFVEVVGVIKAVYIKNNNNDII